MPTKTLPQSTANDAPSSVLWLGSEFKNDVQAGYIGGVYALSGSLDAPGWLVRAESTYVGYDFDSTLSPTGSAHGDVYRGGASIGYQVLGGGLAASGYVGLDYQQYNINPAAADTGQLNDKLGVLLSGRIATTGDTRYPFAIDGHYSTANNDFWVRGRPGLRFGDVTVGPEVVGLGNTAFDEIRTGGYVSYVVSRTWIVQANLGYAADTRNNNSGRGGDGIYGGVTLVLLH